MYPEERNMVPGVNILNMVPGVNILRNVVPGVNILGSAAELD